MKHFKIMVSLVLIMIVVALVIAFQPQRIVYGQVGDHNIYLPLAIKNYPSITKIAFISERDGNREIYLINSDGTNLTRLTNNSVEDFDPGWSPDGNDLVYWSNQNGNAEIYKVNMDSSNLTRLTNNASNESSPIWSPDGQKIAFRTDRHGSSNYEIYLMNPDGSNEMRLTNNATNDNYPIWSPDGSQLAFVGSGEIFIINSDGTGQTKITSKSSAYAYDIDWSPNGTKIAFRGEVGSNQEIFVVNVDGTALKNLTDDIGVDLTPKWSPSGEKLAYTCHFKLCLINPDGTNLVELTDNVGQYPTWSPGGKTIVFSSDRDGNSEIYTINANGTNLARFTNHPEDDWRPVWQP